MLRIFYWLFEPEAASMRPADYLSRVSVPVLFIHAATDAFTLPDHSLRLYAAAGHNDKARLWIGPPAAHTGLAERYPHPYRAKVQRFIAKVHRWLSGSTAD
jgi:fermentation-respiration switch protein FrsA (DUF1100 family)